jgi:hypothetical protein
MRSFSPPSLFLRKLKSSQICVHMFVAGLASWFLALLQRAGTQRVARRLGYTVMCPLLRTVMALSGSGPLSGMPSGSLASPVCAPRAPSFLRLLPRAPPSPVARAMPCTTVRVPSRAGVGKVWPLPCAAGA